MIKVSQKFAHENLQAELTRAFFWVGTTEVVSYPLFCPGFALISACSPEKVVTGKLKKNFHQGIFPWFLVRLYWVLFGRGTKFSVSFSRGIVIKKKFENSHVMWCMTVVSSSQDEKPVENFVA